MGDPDMDTDDPPPQIAERIEYLERRLDILHRTVDTLVAAALDDACQGLSSEEVDQSCAAGVQAMVETANRLRVAS